MDQAPKPIEPKALPKRKEHRIKKTKYVLRRPVFAMPMLNFEAIYQFLVTELQKKPETTYDKIFYCNFLKF